MSEEKTGNPAEGLVRIHPGAQMSMRDMMGSLGVDSAIRNAIQHCWMVLPEAERSPERVEQEILRIVQRVLRDLKEDAHAFGYTKGNLLSRQ